MHLQWMRLKFIYLLIFFNWDNVSLFSTGRHGTSYRTRLTSNYQRSTCLYSTVAWIRKMSCSYTRTRFMQCIFFTYTCLWFLSFVHKIDLLNLLVLCKVSAVSVCILEEELISTHSVSSLWEKGKNGSMIGFISYEFLISSRTCDFYLILGIYKCWLQEHIIVMQQSH